MKTSRVALRAGLWAIIIANIFFALNFLCQTLLTRKLDPGEIGQFVLALASYEIVGALFNFGFQFSYISSAGTEEDFDNHWILVNAIGLVSFILGLLLVSVHYAFGLSGGIINVMVGLLLGIGWPRALGELYLSPMRREMKFKLPTMLAGGSNTIGIAMAVAMVYSGFGIWSLLAREAITSCLLLISGITFSSASFKGTFNRTKAIEQIRFGFGLMFSRGAETLYYRLPMIVFGNLFGKAALGKLAQANYLSELFNRLLAPMTETVAYSASAKSARENVRKELPADLFLFLVTRCALPISLVVYCLGHAIFPLVFGSQWVAGGAMFESSAIIILLSPVFLVLKSSANALGDSLWVSKAYIAAMVATLAFMAGFKVAGTIDMVPWGMGAGMAISIAILILRLKTRHEFHDLARNLVAPIAFFLVYATIEMFLHSLVFKILAALGIQAALLVFDWKPIMRLASREEQAEEVASASI